ncbi:MAG: hypothetical protein LJE94_15625 [Deltaproteobacteria bacterium]|nr:hypothetical protein [Deltaproteobacteria bacterium]
MYALICDEFDPTHRKKRVISVHRTRTTAEKAQLKLPHKLFREDGDCYTRVVWVNRPTHKGEYITPDDFDTWAPGEEIPAGDRTPECD